MFGFLSAKVLGSIAGVAVVAAVGWFLVNTIERAALAEAQVESYQLALVKQSKAIADYEKRIQEHQRKVRSINNDLAEWQNRWREIQADSDVSDWVHTHMPEHVRIRVRELVTPPDGSGTDWGAFIEDNAVAVLW